MRVLLKIILGIVVAIILLAISILVYMRIGYEVAAKKTCINHDQVNVEELKKKVIATNSSTDPYIVLRLDANETQYLINETLRNDGITSCVVIGDNTVKMLLSKNPFVWVEADIVPATDKPFVKVSRIHWDAVSFPGVFEGMVNKSLTDGFDSYFGGAALASRYFDHFEVDGSTILIYSSIKK